VREMGQSAWLNTSSLTLQGSEERVNERETVSLVGFVQPNKQDRLAVKCLESASQSEKAPHQEDLG
jgi:hypothetical protein